MGPATLLKNAVIDKAAMWELVPLDTECVAHVKLHSWKIRIISYRVRGLFSSLSSFQFLWDVGKNLWRTTRTSRYYLIGHLSSL